MDQYDFSKGEVSWEELLGFGGKFEKFYKFPQKMLEIALGNSYREILRNNEGTAFSLPRDSKVWELVKQKFEETLEVSKLLRE